MSILGSLFAGTKKQMEVNAQEVYTLWDLLNTRYSIVNSLKINRNFIHDSDFRKVVDGHVEAFSKEVNEFEKKLQKVAIKGPQPAVTDTKIATSNEVMRDEDIAWNLYNYYRGELKSLTRSFRDHTTNDNISEWLIKITKQTLHRYHNYVDYLKKKGWINIPPRYPHVPDDVDEEILTTEVYQLWSHLTFRYANIHLTKILSTYTNDKDFDLLLETGKGMLENQMSKIEKLLLYFGVPLPREYSDLIPQPDMTENIGDEFIFTTVYNGMQSAAVLHSSALIDGILNKRAKDLFEKLYFAELNYISKMIKYGKMKGWIIPAPRYTRNQT
ncbi:Protein of unknown function (DUF3231) [Halobacteroides halobius DSM 5150]|uniref:DUF3231 family protein n=1 Tax=Halobacteroides halobius (strain ATCC 35273 / DSM 5150 / MD-1) TaxID=748449 RepID=L0KAN9_HALHC|nr:DUF3231 family protein [Halobacteroides halobius]AGB41163.1 Protein of unknown function (DUF3231) [Halobacteroides halobius DSM 5150]